MGQLYNAVLSRLPAPRLVQLTQSENPGGLKIVTITGTVTVTKGSTALVGSGTAFTSEIGANTLIQFSAQPGVSYLVASVTDATNAVLAVAYFGITTAGASGYLPQIDYGRLQQAVYDAQAHFQARTNFAFDDVTSNANTTPLTLNKCIYAGVALVVAYLYEGRGQAWPDAEIQAAWAQADRRLNEILHVYGDGAYSNPVTDSVFTPTVGPSRLPQFDNARFGDISALPPGPGTGNADGGTSEY